MIDMPAGMTHRFKFIVDDEWKCSDDLPMTTDSEGNLVNFLEVMDEKGDHMGDGLDGLSHEREYFFTFSLTYKSFLIAKLIQKKNYNIKRKLIQAYRSPHPRLTTPKFLGI